eukprot:jgi/Tetstr1/456958/TSEL_043627.t1
MQSVGTIGPPLHLAPRLIPRPSPQLVGVNIPPLHHVSGCFRSPGTQSVGAKVRHCTNPGTQSVGAKGRHCTMCPGRFRDPGGHADGRPPLDIVPQSADLAVPGTQLVARAYSWSAPSGRRCTLCSGGFHSPGTQLVGAKGRHCTIYPGHFRGFGTQLVGGIGPPLHPMPPVAAARHGHASGRRQRAADAEYAPVAFAAPGTQMVRAIGLPLHLECALVAFAAPGTKLVGAIGPSLHMVPCPGTQLVGNNRLPLHHVPFRSPGHAIGQH